MAVDDDDDNEWEDEWEDEWENEWEDEWEDELRNEKICRILKDVHGIDSPCANLKGLEISHNESFFIVRDFSCDCQFCGPIRSKVSDLVKVKRPGGKIKYVFVYLPMEGSPLKISIGVRDINSPNLTIDIYAPTFSTPIFSHSLLLHNISSLHHVEPDSSALQCFNLARHWLHDCLANHESCRLEPTPHLPKTFLQISSGRRHPEARLMTDTGLKETYAALSHCWGTAEFLTLTRANFGSLEQNVPWENLPKAFQDAIKVCLELGLSNLWIDSLCILQDSREDWEEQSACMGDIYRNATVVIAANSGSGAHEGFLGPRKEQFVECIVPPSSASPGVYARPHILHYCELSTDETLSKRAWTYQERLLARRYLSFNKKELHWECESAWQCECGVGEWTKGSPHEFSLQQLCNVTMNKEELYKVWRQVIVQNYAGRELSKESDELPALSAVAQVFQTKLQDTYLAGLWNGDIIRGLCWVRASWFEQYPNGPPSYRAPSWAWSSIDAPVDDRSGQQEFVTYSQLLEAECVPFGASNLGEVKDGFITLRGPLVRAFIGLSACGFNPGEIVQVWTFNVRDGSSTGYPNTFTSVSNFYSDSPLRKHEATEDNCTHISLFRTSLQVVQSLLKGTKGIDNFKWDTQNAMDHFAPIWCLRLTEDENQHGKSARLSRALILSTSPTNPNLFIRLGLSFKDKGEHDVLFANAKTTEVTII